MGKQLKLETKAGRVYILEYTRRTVQIMGNSGFNINKMDENPMLILDLFAGAFLSKHRNTPRAEIEDLYDALPRNSRGKLIEKLSEMYSQPILALMGDEGETPEGDEGNATWTEL